MKTRTVLLIFLFSYICCGSSCEDKGKDKEEYPFTVAVGERTLTGHIISMPNPPTSQPPLPGVVLGLETDSGDYVLSYDSHGFREDFTFDDVVYSIDDEVEITGMVSTIHLSSSVRYTELAIKTIRKKPAEQ